MILLDVPTQVNGGRRRQRNGKTKCELSWATKERGKETHMGLILQPGTQGHCPDQGPAG